MELCITWDKHIDQVTRKVSKGIGLLRRSKDLVNKISLDTIYQVLVLPHFNYCALVWDNCSITLQNKLEKLQALSNRPCYNLRSNNRVLSLPQPNTNAFKKML